MNDTSTTANAVAGHLDAPAEAISIAAQLFDRTAATLAPEMITRSNSSESAFITTPVGYTLHNITEQLERAEGQPSRMRGNVTLRSIDSMISLCDRLADESSVIYANADTGVITAVFNDHKEPGSPGWRDHRATFKAERTPEFEAWLRRDKQPFDQVAFAEFVEAHIADIADPQAASVLLTVATTIQAKTGINFGSARRLDNGQAQITYHETIDAKAGAAGDITIPTTFALGLRVFKGDTAGIKFNARLKYRLASGAVKFFYELDRPERVIEQAFADYLDRLREGTQLLVVQGDA